MAGALWEKSGDTEKASQGGGPFNQIFQEQQKSATWREPLDCPPSPFCPSLICSLQSCQAPCLKESHSPSCSYIKSSVISRLSQRKPQVLALPRSPACSISCLPPALLSPLLITGSGPPFCSWAVPRSFPPLSLCHCCSFCQDCPSLHTWLVDSHPSDPA